MRQKTGTIAFDTPGRGLLDVTERVLRWAEEQGMSEGLLTLFCRHTSASLIIQENAAPAARRDLERWFARIAPEGAGYEHDEEGPDDMPAHIRSAITQVQLSIPLIGAASRSAPGRASICSSIAGGRTAARSRCT